MNLGMHCGSWQTDKKEEENKCNNSTLARCWNSAVFYAASVGVGRCCYFTSGENLGMQKACLFLIQRASAATLIMTQEQRVTASEDCLHMLSQTDTVWARSW